MKRYSLFFAFFLFFTLDSCSPPSMDAVWKKDGYTSRHFDNLAVVAVTKSLEARQSVEDAISSYIEDEELNIKITTGLTLFPPNRAGNEFSEEEISAILAENNVDAVLTVSVVDSYTSERMTNSGGPVYYPYYYNVGPYIYNTYDYIYNSPQYETAQNYIIESSLFDLQIKGDKDEVIIWKGQDKITNPSSISSSARSYAKNLVGYLKDDRLLK